MNEQLLNTPIVKSSIERYLGEKMSLEDILYKLQDIHLIVITKQDLEAFIEIKNLNP